MADQSIAVLGGTGKLGAAIAWRLARAGVRVTIGSRSEDGARTAAQELGFGIVGATNEQAAATADLLILTVPFAAQEATLAGVASAARGKILVDTTVPLVPPRVMRVQLPPEGSAAVRAQQILGSEVNVVSAFHTIAAHKLASDEEPNGDTLVFGDDKDARERVIALAQAMGLRGLHGGPLVNSAAAEAMTSVLIFLNKTYGVDGAGVRIAGIVQK